MSETALAELLCARICHDLSGPVGAVAAGAELMAEDGMADPEAMDLLALSAQAAIARLKFLRAAFGPAAPLEGGRLRALITAFLDSDGRGRGEAGAVELIWPDRWTLPDDRARLLLNLVMIARDCIPRGGVLRVSCDQPELLTALGPRAALHAETSAVLDAGEPPVSPRGAQVAFTLGEASRLGYDIEVRRLLESVSIGLKRA